MNTEKIKYLLKNGILRKRQLDKEKIKSLINSSRTNASVAKSINLNEDSATLIFREIYESIRQIGDAEWGILGYEPMNHEISLEILQGLDIKEKTKLNYLNRFKSIRHDANYRGFKVSVSQAKEIIDLWDKCFTEIIETILDGLNGQKLENKDIFNQIVESEKNIKNGKIKEFKY